MGDGELGDGERGAGERPRPAGVVARLPAGSRAVVAGRLIHVDGHGGVLLDQSGKLPLHFARCEGPVGALCTARGTWTGKHLEVESVEVGTAPRHAFPLADGDFAWLRADGGRRLENLRLRAATLATTRSFFEERGFLEVETPTLVRSPGTELHLDAFRVAGDPPRYLITSPELHMKRLLAAGCERIFQITRAYRRDEAGGLHHPEFTMLEWYRAFSGSARVMGDTEALVAHVAEEVLGQAAVRAGGSTVDVSPPWDRIRVDEALERYAGAKLSALLSDEERFYRTWIEEVEPELGRERATFVTHYPAQMASLARLLPEEPAFADRFEAYVGGIELCNGFGELVDADEQRARMEAEAAERRRRGMEPHPVDEPFLRALGEGVPESGGNALGMDRLVMMICGESEVAEVMAFAGERV